MKFFEKESILSVIYSFASLIVLWLVWEILAYDGEGLARILPPPSQFIGSAFSSNFNIGIGSQSMSIGLSILSSIYRVMAGLIIAFGLSILVGVLISNSIIIKRILMPVVRLFAPIAPIAWVPIALVIFGIGNFTAIFIVIMGVFFTLTIATIQAIDEVPDEIISSAKTLGASKYQIISRVVVPYIMPSIFLSLRLNFIAAWMAVLAAEMTGLRDGLGAIIMVGRNLFNYDLILMGMFLIGVVGFLTDVSLRNIQEKYFWWSKK